MTDRDLLGPRARGWRLELGHLLEQTTLMRRIVSPAGISAKCRVMRANSSAIGQVVGKGWLAVGDAAMAWDPLAGQGTYQALESGRRAANALAETLGRGSDALADYQAWMVALWQAYLRALSLNYQSGNRWPRSPFWSRRAPAQPK